tara:strand:+ start:60 stop:236 length:177 start_codon:yes stop_codon:yes gene_type:complete
MAGPVSIPLVKKGLAVAGALGAYAFGSAGYLIHQARKDIRKDKMQQPRSAATSEEKPK